MAGQVKMLVNLMTGGKFYRQGQAVDRSQLPKKYLQHPYVELPAGPIRSEGREEPPEPAAPPRASAVKRFYCRRGNRFAPVEEIDLQSLEIGEILYHREPAGSGGGSGFKRHSTVTEEWLADYAERRGPEGQEI